MVTSLNSTFSYMWATLSNFLKMKPTNKLLIAACILMFSLATEGSNIAPRRVAGSIHISPFRNLDEYMAQTNSQSVDLERLQGILDSLPDLGSNELFSKAHVAHAHYLEKGTIMKVEYEKEDYGFTSRRSEILYLIPEQSLGLDTKEDYPREPDYIILTENNEEYAKLNLQELMFESVGIDGSYTDFERLNHLLDMNKHWLLSDEYKSDMFNRLVINNLEKHEVEDVILDTVIRLIQEGFYIKGSEEALYHILLKERVLQEFLIRHREEYGNLTFDVIGVALQNDDYKSAEVAIALGADPSQVHHGRNALDNALASNLACQQRPAEQIGHINNFNQFCEVVEHDRFDFIDKMIEIHGVEESFNFENFYACCSEEERRYDYAVDILKASEDTFLINRDEYLQGDNKISPLSVAIDIGYLPLIREAEKWLEISGIRISQLEFVLQKLEVIMKPGAPPRYVESSPHMQIQLKYAVSDLYNKIKRRLNPHQN